MTITYPGGGTPASTAATLRALADDIERMAMFMPGDEELANAPLLDVWDLSARPVPSLDGRVTGHPILGCRSVFTSEVFAIDPDRGWARTFNRFYRLGTRADQLESN